MLYISAYNVKYASRLILITCNSVQVGKTLLSIVNFDKAKITSALKLRPLFAVVKFSNLGEGESLWEDVEVGAGSHVAVGKLRQAEEQDVHDDVDLQRPMEDDYHL